MGASLIGKGNYYDALQRQLDALHLSEEKKLNNYVGLSNSLIGATHAVMGDNHNLLKYYKKSTWNSDILITEFNKIDQEEVKNGVIGAAYFYMNQIDSALIYLQNAYNIDMVGHHNWCVPLLSSGADSCQETTVCTCHGIFPKRIICFIFC